MLALTALSVFWLMQAEPGARTTPAQTTPAAETPASVTPDKPATAERTQLNLLGQTDTKSGESRRNENIQFNLIDNNAQKELNQRIGVTATVVPAFSAERQYFGAEYGGSPAGPFLAAPTRRSSWRGQVGWGHQNSALTARAFFQVGGVLPSRENQFSASAGGQLWRGANLSVNGGWQTVRGMVNGNILAPLASERTPLVTDPARRAYVQQILNAYPDLPQNRPDIDARMINLNSPQDIVNRNGNARLDQRLSDRDTVVGAYTFLLQTVKAFQFVRGQNPDTTTRAHDAAATWNRAWSAATVSQVGFRFFRTGSIIVPENRNLGPQIFVSNVLSQINPNNPIPIDRAQNQFRTAGQVRRSQGEHNWTFGFEAIRQQLNGRESDAHLGAFSFNNNFGNDAITNLRLGLATTYFRSIGEIHRGFRYWQHFGYVGDQWRVRPGLSLSYGLTWRPSSRPSEVNGRDEVPYRGDWNNLAPYFGLAQQLPGRWGVLRVAGGIHYGEIFPVTFQQVRFNAPDNQKFVVQDPDLLNPIPSQAGGARTVLYDYEPDLVVPYSMQYNASWEIDLNRRWRAQAGYVGSRAVKLLHHWYFNRGLPRPGVPLTTGTIDQRRELPQYTDIRRVTNGSRAYFDALRLATNVNAWRGVTLDAAYWFSKSLDLGADYTNVAHDGDSFRTRSQTENDVHRDMKGRSRFDQPHAFLARIGYDVPTGRPVAWLGRWNVSSVLLAKTGTPFNLQTGSDAPGFGNADGIGGDRPMLLDPAILGRAIDHPDRSRQLLPRSAFGYVPVGVPAGNLGRHVFRRGPIQNWNAGLGSTWSLQGDRRLTFRAEAVNLTNTPQFAEPGFSLTDANFGVITNTLNDGRTVRFQLGLSF